MAASPNGCYSERCKAVKEEDDSGNIWKRNLDTEMWTAGFRYSWRKMKAVAQELDGVEGRDGQKWIF